MRKSFVTGLVLLLPLAMTLALCLFFIHLLTNPFMQFFQDLLQSYDIVKHGFLFLSPEHALRILSQTLIIVTLIGVTLILGVLARYYFIHTLIELGDKFLHKIPLVNKVYKTAKEVVTTIATPESTSFKEVVMVPFPQPNVQSLGLVTSGDTKGPPDELVTVFVPATPNPTMGYLVIYRRDQVHFLDMSVEEALKTVISCGLMFSEVKIKEKI